MIDFSTNPLPELVPKYPKIQTELDLIHHWSTLKKLKVDQQSSDDTEQDRLKINLIEI